MDSIFNELIATIKANTEAIKEENTHLSNQVYQLSEELRLMREHNDYALKQIEQLKKDK